MEKPRVLDVKSAQGKEKESKVNNFSFFFFFL